ncbi:MAG: motility associated factor glycosyltransferase family protein [Nitrospinae bacterium]|nr:motility associated factor glycosyltransferase family protein [Nitrospinota bacterium]
MSSIFSNNLAAIRKNDPNLADALENLPASSRVKRESTRRRCALTVKTADGEGVINLPDLASPALDKMAYRLAGARMAVALGFGSGRLFSEIVQRTNEQTFVLLVEPDLDLFAAVISEEDFTKVFEMGRVSLAVGEKPHAAIIIRAEKEFDVFTLPDFPVVENPWTVGLYPGYFAEVGERIAQLKKMGEQNLSTLAALGGQWMDNIVTNLPAVLCSPPVSSLFGKFRGVPAVIVSAGPSLDKNSWLLSSAHGRAIVIAVDTAVRPLLEAGVTPDVVVALDSQPENYFHLAGVSLPGALFVLNPVVHPMIVEEHRGPMVFTSYSHPMFQWMETVIGERGIVRTGGSVATSAFDLAVKMGCDPVVFTGQDLCYSKRATHAAGSMQSMLTAPVGRSLFESIPALKAGSTEAVNIFGEKTFSNIKMDAWRKWFELIISASDCTALNATEGGAAIKGAQPVSLREVMERWMGKMTDAAVRLEHVCPPVENPEWGTMDSAFTEAREEARFIKNACGRGLNSLKDSLKSLASGSKGDQQAASRFDDVKERAREILTKQKFAEINRWSMDMIMDKVEAIQRKADGLADADRNTISMESYRVLFSEIYETAAKFEKAADRAVNLTRNMRASGAGFWRRAPDSPAVEI